MGKTPVDRRGEAILKFPISTGQAAELIGATEPQIAETVRRGKVHPAPPLFAGRRLWGPEHIRQAAEALGALTADLKVRLRRAAQGAADER